MVLTGTVSKLPQKGQHIVGLVTEKEEDCYNQMYIYMVIIECLVEIDWFSFSTFQGANCHALDLSSLLSFCATTIYIFLLQC